MLKQVLFTPHEVMTVLNRGPGLRISWHLSPASNVINHESLILIREMPEPLVAVHITQYWMTIGHIYSKGQVHIIKVACPEW